MPDLIYALFGNRIKRKLAALEYRPKGFDGMTLAFSAPDGLAYYTWPDLGDLPAVRLKHCERIMIWLDARVTEKSIEEYGDEQSSALAGICNEKDQEKRWQKAVNLGVLYKELLLRTKDIIPEDLYYDLCAILSISEREDPGNFDSTVHQAKMNAFKVYAREGHTFFLGLPILKKSLGSLLTSEDAFRELLRSWMMASERKTRVKESLSFAKG